MCGQLQAEPAYVRTIRIAFVSILVTPNLHRELIRADGASNPSHESLQEPEFKWSQHQALSVKLRISRNGIEL
jgi:hypothetical protein